MANYATFCLLALALCQTAGAARISPVQKVVQMIDEMAGKVQKDLDDTTLLFEDFAKNCDDESYAKEHAIKSAAEDMDSLSSVIESASAKIASSESNIQDVSGKISDQEADLHKSEQLRVREHEQFLSTEKEFLDMVQTLDDAKKIFSQMDGAALVQMDQEKKDNLNKVLASFRAMIESDFVTHAQRAKVQAFLQAKEDAEDSLTIKQGGNEATIQLLDQLLEFSENTLADTRKGETEEAHAHAMLVQGLNDEIKSLNEELNTSTNSKHSNSETNAQAQKELAVTKKGSEETQASLSDLKGDCQKRATGFEEESRDAEAELGALAKAKEILTKKFALIQTAVKIHGEGEDSRARALREIKQLGKKYHSMSLVTLAYRASASPFAKVTGMIEDMIDKLMQEAAEEATQKAFCDTELGTSRKSKAKKEASLAKTNARIDKATSSVAKLTEAIATLSAEITDLDKGMAEAAKIRQAEASEFAKVEKDYSESEEACAAALQALRAYYEGASLLQVSAHTGESKGEGIIGLLEIAESDFAKLLAETRATEEAAKIAHTKEAQDNKMEKATKEVDVKSKKSELKALQSSLANYNGDKEGVQTELDAVLAYLDKLKPQCETKVESYAEVKAKREAEIAGLKDALNILSADGGAVLLQTGHSLRR
jgi:hypothetical protein